MIFLKTLRKSIFVDSYFFSYFHGFGEEPFNLQKSVCEEINLATIHLQEWIAFFRDNFEYLTEINDLISIIIKISRECNLTNESQILNIRENIFQGKSNIKFSMHIHSIKVNNKNMETNYDICSKLIRKKLERLWAVKC